MRSIAFGSSRSAGRYSFWMIDGGTFQVGLTVMYFIVSVSSGVAWMPGLPVTTLVVRNTGSAMNHGIKLSAFSPENWKVTFLEQRAHGMHVWQQPFVELRAPVLVNLRMDPFELAQEIGMDYQRWYLEHMFMIAPAAAHVGEWLQSFREFPPRQKPGSFNLERVMEAVTSPQGRGG